MHSLYIPSLSLKSVRYVPCSTEVEATVDLAVELRVVDVELQWLGIDVLDLLRELRNVSLKFGQMCFYLLWFIRKSPKDEPSGKAQKLSRQEKPKS